MSWFPMGESPREFEPRRYHEFVYYTHPPANVTPPNDTRAQSFENGR